jgi:hypothetical protein
VLPLTPAFCLFLPSLSLSPHYSYFNLISFFLLVTIGLCRSPWSPRIFG